MFSHVMVGASDIERSKGFYNAVFKPLGLRLRFAEEFWVSWQRDEEDQPFFAVTMPINEEPPSAGNGSMIAFLAPDRAAVDAAYAGAMAEGGVCEGPPGPRPNYHEHYYGAYFRDPDGNKLHVVCHKPEIAP